MTEQSTENLSSVWRKMPCFSCGKQVWSVRYGGGEWWPAKHICPANDRLAAEAALGEPSEQEER